jgi:hypothetical protein
MPSGFLVLPDGRCLARKWEVYDCVLGAIAIALEADPAQRELRAWLQSLLPGPDDIEELGYGAWLRKADQEPIARLLDMRQLAKPDQDAICAAALAAARHARHPGGCANSLKALAEMVRAYLRRDPPLARSDWAEIMPPDEGRIGPGWQRKVD